MSCVGYGRAAAVALTTVSLFSKCKAADVSRGSDRGEWNVGAIFDLNTHTHQNPLILVSAAAVNPSLDFLHDTYRWSVCGKVLLEPNCKTPSAALSAALM